MQNVNMCERYKQEIMANLRDMTPAQILGMKRSVAESMIGKLSDIYNDGDADDRNTRAAREFGVLLGMVCSENVGKIAMTSGPANTAKNMVKQTFCT